MVYLRGGADPNARNHMGWTLLHLACLEGQTEVVEVLLDAGASVGGGGGGGGDGGSGRGRLEEEEMKRKKKKAEG